MFVARCIIAKLFFLWRTSLSILKHKRKKISVFVFLKKLNSLSFDVEKIVWAKDTLERRFEWHRQCGEVPHEARTKEKISL